ncbi:MAG: putative beta-lysine N-acetyltransferase [Candidatus Neomarinimicrobiota bacterium]|nr:MAG: putative beta-lysine N-acetyltransferase [Candidatus Neomarinimicrobiota bacterium]
MTDKTEYIGKSLIQHGTYNDRIYLMKWGGDDPEFIADSLLELARLKHYTKVFVRIPEKAVQPFIDRGFLTEAVIPDLYAGKEKGFFLGYFLSDRRKKLKREEHLNKVLRTAQEKAVKPAPVSLKKGFTLRMAEEKELPELAKVYQAIFPEYPFPVGNPGFLKESMESGHNRYFMVHNGEKIIAASSAEMYRDHAFVEMTDFATLPDYRGHSLARHLLKEMEKFCSKEGFITAYTIARAVSFGMNITFSRLGYEYCGTMINNTRIGKGIESMNVWYRGLRR